MQFEDNRCDANSGIKKAEIYINFGLIYETLVYKIEGHAQCCNNFCNKVKARLGNHPKIYLNPNELELQKEYDLDLSKSFLHHQQYICI